MRLSGAAAAVFRRVIQNAVAVVALENLLVPEHRVEDLRPQPHVADAADAVARFGDGDAVPLLRHALVDRQQVLVDGGDERGPLRGHALRGGLELAVLRQHLALIGLDGFLLRGELRLAALDRGREVVGLDHMFEHLLLEES